MTAAQVDPNEVEARVRAVRLRLDELGGRTVRILAVTKGFDESAIRAAVAAGLNQIGENYAQEAVPKTSSVRREGLTFEAHFIGHLQSNKVRSLAGVIDVWQTVDRETVLRTLAERVPGARVLLQVNATGESNKGGVDPGAVGWLLDTALGAGLRVDGLMTMGPTNADLALTRHAFRTVRSLVDRFGLGECSMGMSGDLEIAVDEGSTLVRVGTALFGARASRSV